jgi:hypothetical protein
VLPWKRSFILQDLRYAWRSLKRSPGFVPVAILTLAAGMAGSSALTRLLAGMLYGVKPLDPEVPGGVFAGIG